MCLSPCLPACLSAYLCVCLPVCLFVCHLPACLPCPSVCLPVCLSVCLSICLLVCVSACLFVCLHCLPFVGNDVIPLCLLRLPHVHVLHQCFVLPVSGLAQECLVFRAGGGGGNGYTITPQGVIPRSHMLVWHGAYSPRFAACHRVEAGSRSPRGVCNDEITSLRGIVHTPPGLHHAAGSWQRYCLLAQVLLASLKWVEKSV